MLKEQSVRNKETDWLPVLVAALVVISFLFHLIGLGSTRWAGTGHEFRSQQIQRKEHFGLWRYCVDAITESSEKEVCDDFVNIVYSDWLKATQSFMVLSFFAYLASLGTVLLPFIPGFENSRMISIIASAAIFLTGFLQFVALVVFACYFQTYFEDKEPSWAAKRVARIEWSYVLVCLSCISCLIGGASIWFKPQGNETKLYRALPRGQSYRPNVV